ncbi:hypothetical protein [Actinoplanes xinjiangensis]|jgi:hypothetical protein|uniref:MYXO-CTERM domain-containing protein n=1 Tax=Actinoplanes xinjiangensis TaxID=512350 RepID=A0A316G7W6_9ACTN|nr:hypothetical protein [Actinoplanes xinjiangensis]PWK50577.1 hypothetical protein BC793_103463 [Actinoplanes xinjiangensis]GIF36466.1 hypothetical protein Axi01nite_07770 [Actinoplanes xinjiangensis]
MSDNQVDPSGNTEAFRAFTRPGPDAEAPSKVPYLVGGLVAVVLIALLVVLLVR